jgi:hypothetical protein
MILPLTLLISGCGNILKAPEPVVVTVPKIVKNEIPLVARPKPVTLVDTKIYVVTAENYDTFIEEFKAKNGDLVYVAISIKDYENLSINISELRRFINQQKEIIVYYEESIQEPLPEETSVTQ